MVCGWREVQRPSPQSEKSFLCRRKKCCCGWSTVGQEEGVPDDARELGGGGQVFLCLPVDIGCESGEVKAPCNLVDT